MIDKIINTAALKKLIISILKAYRNIWRILIPDIDILVPCFLAFHFVIFAFAVPCIISIMYYFPITFLIPLVVFGCILLKAIKRGYNDFKKEINE